MNNTQIASRAMLKAKMRINEAEPTVIHLSVFSEASFSETRSMKFSRKTHSHIPRMKSMVTTPLSQKELRGSSVEMIVGPNDTHQRYDQGEVITSTKPNPNCLSTELLSTDSSLPNSDLLLRAPTPIYPSIPAFKKRSTTKKIRMVRSPLKNSAPMKRTMVAIRKSAVEAPRPVIIPKIQPNRLLVPTLIISMFTGPSGAASENPSVAKKTT